MNRKMQISMLILTSSALLSAAQWQPAKGPLMTRWAKDVTPENVWPQYPRPQMVRDNWTNLNGLWDYAITSADASQPQNWDGQILVPFCAESALSGVARKVLPDQNLWYKRTFEAPQLTDGKRLLLHFDAVDWKTTVWVNGIQAGTHVGGFDPFTFDITDLVKAGSNEMVVQVWDPTDKGGQPRGKQVLSPGGIMYTAVTGIWQTVWLETVPANYIQSLKIIPDIDRQVVQVTVNTASGGDVQIQALDKGKSVVKRSGKAGEAIELKISKPKLWNSDTPNLYDLKVTLQDGRRTVDSVDSYFGMRKIEVKKDKEGINRLFLNNEVMFQYGPLDQGWWPDGLFTPATYDAMIYDIEMTKKFGMNMARKHVKYESPLWYNLCDKMGLLVWQDMPAGDTGRDQESKANFLVELQAMVDTLHNFPCIVMWIPFNEGWGQHDTVNIVKWMQSYDPTRPINEASGWHDRGSGDVSDMHKYPEPGVRPLEEDRVCVLGEFGGLGLPVKGHLWQEDRNWGYISYQNSEELTDAYVRLMVMMRPLISQGLSAAVYTQTSDVEIEVNGLLTYDREVVKMDVERCAEAARKLYGPAPKVVTLVKTSRDEKPVWKYTTQQPGDNWTQPGFDDSGWKQGPGGFGKEGTPGAVIGTEWNSTDIWLRRTVELKDVPTDGQMLLDIHHDEDAQVYLNGRLIAELQGFTSAYKMHLLGKDALDTLKQGENTLAIHCRQTTGGQFIDAGLSVMVEK